MPPNINQPIPQSSVPLKKILYIGAFLILTALAVWYGLLTKDGVRKFDPQGTILLTLSSKGSDDVGIYAFNVNTKNLSPYYVPLGVKSITANKHTNTDGILLATNAVVPARGSLFQIATYNKETDSLTQLTQSNVAFKRHPSYSAALDLFVYGGKDPASTTLSGTASEFNVYTRDASGVEKKVGQGSIPTLTPDGKSVVVMRKDGLSVIDLQTGTSEIIWPLAAGTAQINQQFAISADGGRIAWSNPNEGFVYVVDVKSWAPFTAVAVPQKIEAHAFWPTFSPYGDYLAYEEVERGTVPTKPRLVVYDLETHEKKTLQDLDAFTQERMFITAWYQ